MSELALNTLITVSVTVSVTLIITFVFNTLINGTKKKRAEKEQQKEERFRQMIREETQRNFEEGIKNDILIKNGLQVILKNDLKTNYDSWIRKRYAPLDAKDDLERMYQVYHSLGANGVMDAHREKFLALPTSKELLK